LGQQELQARAREAMGRLRCCTICPRLCRVDRTQGQRGFCRTLDVPFVSSWGPHFGEERPLVGRHGSGTIFFGQCNLRCLYCQNWSISQLGEGAQMSTRRLAELMLELQGLGCHNINLVTPTHQVPMILQALVEASREGLRLPIVYNTGGYESIETLRLLEGIVDIYMPDFKYWDPQVAKELSKAEDYPQVAREALKEMHRQVGDLVIKEGVAVRGLLVRHLVLPGGLAGTPEVMRFIAQELSPNTYVNVMAQYYPCYKAFEHPPLDRRLSPQEYKDAVEAALRAGLKRLDGITV